jgi:hypothetical protein
MSKAVRTKAKELLGFGMPKQAAFDTLVLEHPEVKPKKIAETLRYMPTAWSRERHRTTHLALLGLIALSALLRLIGPMLKEDVRWDVPTAYLSLVPIASLLVGWSIYRWQGQVFEWVGWGNALGAAGLLSAVRALAEGRGEAGSIAANALSAAIGVLALVLAYRVFAKPKVEKDSLGGPDRYVFPVEGEL